MNADITNLAVLISTRSNEVVRTAAQLWLTSALSRPGVFYEERWAESGGWGRHYGTRIGLAFFCFLSFIFPVIMSALQYLMTAHLFGQFQVAPL